MQNIATLLDPPGITMDEAQWVGGAAREANKGLLHDLHNAHTNAIKLKFDPRMPLERVSVRRSSLYFLIRWYSLAIHSGSSGSPLLGMPFDIDQR